MNSNSTATQQFSTLNLGTTKAWLMALAFVCGNIILPQLAHLMPQGGLIFLPIYFFTLIAAYKFGWQVGVVTAIASPLLNSALFGMPPAQMLPIIMLKGSLLAAIAGYAAHRFGKVNLLILAGVVLAYQTIGCAVESLMLGSMAAGVQDFTLGYPGMILQVVGAWLILRGMSKIK